MASRWKELAQGARRAARRSVALLALATFFAALPAGALAHAAEPVTLADWLRAIFVTPDRKIDRTAPAVAVATPPPPPLVLQTSSQQVPPKAPVIRDRIPEAWLRDPWKSRKRGRVPPLA